MRATPMLKHGKNGRDHQHRLLNRMSLWLRLKHVPQICAQAVHHQDKRQMLKEQQVKNKSIISTIKKVAERNQEPQLSDFQVGTC